MSTPDIDYREQLLKEISGLSQQDLRTIYQMIVSFKARAIVPDKAHGHTPGQLEAEKEATEAYEREGAPGSRTVREMAEHSLAFRDARHKNDVSLFTCEIELLPNEKLALPESLAKQVGAGRWLITISPLGAAHTPEPIRNHSAFLTGYALEDEGLYDDYPPR